MFLRPTESPTVFLQQLGRGLREYNDKKYLNILDFIGNYKKAELGSRPTRVEFFINIDNDVYSAIKNKSALNPLNPLY